jgi:hypothetical protein
MGFLQDADGISTAPPFGCCKLPGRRCLSFQKTTTPVSLDATLIGAHAALNSFTTNLAVNKREVSSRSWR